MISPNDTITEPGKECRDAQDIVDRGHRPDLFRAAAPPTYKEPLDAKTLDTIRSGFSKLMELANRHDFKALHEMFWQSPSTLLVGEERDPL